MRYRQNSARNAVSLCCLAAISAGGCAGPRVYRVQQTWLHQPTFELRRGPAQLIPPEDPAAARTIAFALPPVCQRQEGSASASPQPPLAEGVSCDALASQLEASAVEAGFSVVPSGSLRVGELLASAREQGVDILVKVLRVDFDVQLQDLYQVSTTKLWQDGEPRTDADLERISSSCFQRFGEPVSEVTAVKLTADVIDVRTAGSLWNFRAVEALEAPAEHRVEQSYTVEPDSGPCGQMPVVAWVAGAGLLAGAAFAFGSQVLQLNPRESANDAVTLLDLSMLMALPVIAVTVVPALFIMERLRAYPTPENAVCTKAKEEGEGDGEKRDVAGDEASTTAQAERAAPSASDAAGRRELMNRVAKALNERLRAELEAMAPAPATLPG